MVIKLDPIGQYTAGMLERFEAMAVDTLLFDRADHVLDKTILLGAMRRDEFLLQPVAPHERRVAATRKHQSVIGAQEKRRWDAAQRAESCDQRVFEGGRRRRRLPTPRQMSAQQFSRVTVDHQRERGPAIATGPDSAEIRRPAHIGGRRDGRHGLHTWAKPHRAFLHLPAAELKHALDGVLVEAQQMRDGAIAE